MNIAMLSLRCFYFYILPYILFKKIPQQHAGYHLVIIRTKFVKTNKLHCEEWIRVMSIEAQSGPNSLIVYFHFFTSARIAFFRLQASGLYTLQWMLNTWMRCGDVFCNLLS
jgi:hypothetical protein